MKFEASLDKLAIFLSLVVTLLVTAILFVILLYLTTQPQLLSKHIGLLLLGGVILVMHFIILFYRPLYYSLSNTALIIHRPLFNKEIPLNQIEDIQSVQWKALRNTYRVWGVWGIFGYFGYFKNMTLGGMRWYATQRKHFILLTLSQDQWVVITPDDPLLAEKIEQRQELQ